LIARLSTFAIFYQRFMQLRLRMFQIFSQATSFPTIRITIAFNNFNVPFFHTNFVRVFLLENSFLKKLKIFFVHFELEFLMSTICWRCYPRFDLQFLLFKLCFAVCIIFENFLLETFYFFKLFL